MPQTRDRKMGISVLTSMGFENRDFLKNAIRNYSFIQLSEMMGVSDKTIVKWCKKLNLPFKKNDIQKYTNEEWLLI